MPSRRPRYPNQPRTDIDGALEALDATELRELIRDELLILDERTRDRVVDSLINRAVRGTSGWAPAAIVDRDVAESLAFAEAARKAGYADPSTMDDHLRRGSDAFLRKNYTAAHRILGALLRPIGEGEIDLGQDEMADEVLGVDPHDCAAQYVVAAYMISEPSRRAEAVRTAIDEVGGVGYFMEPIAEMERVAVEPLPRLDEFLRQWRDAVAQRATPGRRDDWDTDQDRWLREVVRRLEGAAGLAKVARSTRRADDLRAWCQSLVEARDWKAALSAFEEAAKLVADKEYARGEFLDGSALAAQELGRTDLPARLERAWRGAPSMLRLRRWLGSASGKEATKKRAAEALDACPKQAHRQGAFLHVLSGDFERAAKLLATAPGLGWSNGEHPGHLLFPIFEMLLGSRRKSASSDAKLFAQRGMGIEELELMTAEPDEPRLASPEITHILQQADIGGISDDRVRGAVLAAMRKAAEHRLAGVTEQKRRRHYGHAAELVAACVACQGSPDATRWVASINTEYSRFPALRAELERQVRSS